MCWDGFSQGSNLDSSIMLKAAGCFLFLCFIFLHRNVNMANSSCMSKWPSATVSHISIFYSDCTLAGSSEVWYTYSVVSCTHIIH